MTLRGRLSDDENHKGLYLLKIKNYEIGKMWCFVGICGNVKC